jgi:ribosome biogenesis GTPase
VVRLRGRIIKSTGSWYEVAIQEGRGNGNAENVINARLPGRFRLDDRELTNPVAVGDYVDLSLNDDGTGTIEEIEERKNYITRQRTEGRANRY